MFREKVVLRNFAKFTGKHLCQSLFFNKNNEFCEISKNNFYYRTPPMAASVILLQKIDKKIQSNLYRFFSFWNFEYVFTHCNISFINENVQE